MCIYIDIIYLYAIIKTMRFPVYHHKELVATHALGHMMYANLAFVGFEHSVSRRSLVVISGR